MKIIKTKHEYGNDYSLRVGSISVDLFITKLEKAYEGMLEVVHRGRVILSLEF